MKAREVYCFYCIRNSPFSRRPSCTFQKFEIQSSQEESKKKVLQNLGENKMHYGLWENGEYTKEKIV